MQRKMQRQVEDVDAKAETTTLYEQSNLKRVLLKEKAKSWRGR